MAAPGAALEDLLTEEMKKERREALVQSRKELQKEHARRREEWKQKKVLQELEFWELFLKRAVDEGQLIVGWKPILRISPQIFDVEDLRALRLIGCELTEFPDAFSERQSSLRSLFLPSNKLQTLPPSIRYLTNLTELNIIDNNMRSLPDEICCLTALTDLQLTRNHIRNLPEKLGALRKLPRLNFDCNSLETLPKSLTKATTRRLNLNYNRFTTLPGWFCRMEHLTQLFLNKNRLTEIPMVLAALPSLTHLSLAHNTIAEFPKQFPLFTNLTKLWLDWNRITRIPLVFQRLTRLEELKLEGNPLRRPRMQFLVEEGVKGLSEWCAKEEEANDGKRGRATIVAFMDVLRVVHREALAPPDIFEADTELTYNGYPAKYFAFVWHDFFKVVWPKARKYWHDHSLPVYGESLDETTARIGEGGTDALNPPGTFWGMRRGELEERLTGYEDAGGPVFRPAVMVRFKRCGCKRNGLRHVCVPPSLDHMCERVGSVVKMGFQTEEAIVALRRKKWAEDTYASVVGNARRNAELWCHSAEGQEYFTKFADQYALEDQEEEWVCNWEGKIEGAFHKDVVKHKEHFHTRKGDIVTRQQAFQEPLQQQVVDLKKNAKFARGLKKKNLVAEIARIEGEIAHNQFTRELAALEIEEGKAWEKLQEDIGEWKAKYKQPGTVALARKIDAKRRDKAIRRYVGEMVEVYVNEKVEAAEARISAVLPRVQKILEAWTTAGLKKVFVEWKKWYRLSKDEREQALAAQIRDARREMDAMFGEEEHTYLNLQRWARGVDKFTDDVYWEHQVTGEVVWENPITEKDLEVLARRKDKEKPYFLPDLMDDAMSPLPGGPVDAHPETHVPELDFGGMPGSGGYPAVEYHVPDEYHHPPPAAGAGAPAGEDRL